MTLLAQLDDVKDYLHIDLDDSSSDRILLRLLRAESEFVESECRRVFSPRQYMDTRGPSDRKTITLKRYPVIEIQSVMIDDQEVNVDRLDSESGIAFRRDGWRGEIAISYTAGFDPIPTDIEQAVIEMVVLKYQQSIEESTGKTRQTQGSLTVEYTQVGIPHQVAAVLDRYRVVEV